MLFSNLILLINIMVCNCSNSTTTVLNCQIFAVLSERQTVNLEHAITCPELLNSCSVNKTASKKYGVMSCCPMKLRKKVKVFQ